MFFRWLRTSDPVSRFIKRHVSPRSVAFDIGAHHGRYATQLAALCQHVYAFEPNPESIRKLRANTERFTNVTVVPKAVADRRGRIDFHVDTRPDWAGLASSVHMLDDLARAGQTRSIQVDAITIDEFCAQGMVPHFVKIDVEGHEPAVIAGARRTISTARPTLVFEFWETWWERGYRDMFAYLHEFYDLVRLQDGSDAMTLYNSRPHNGVADIAAIPRM